MNARTAFEFVGIILIVLILRQGFLYFHVKGITDVCTYFRNVPSYGECYSKP